MLAVLLVPICTDDIQDVDSMIVLHVHIYIGQERDLSLMDNDNCFLVQSTVKVPT